MRLYRLISCFVIFFSFLLMLQAQHIELSFPQVDKLNLYYFQGSRVDSVFIGLNENGYASYRLPEGYRGLIRLNFGKQGLIECIAGEPNLLVESKEHHIGRDNIKMPGSIENDFLYGKFSEKTLINQRLAWLQQGLFLYESDEEMNPVLTKEKEKEENQLFILNKEIEASSLYASSLLQIIDFSNDLIVAVERGNTLDIENAGLFLQNRMDWDALYTAGDFWSLTLQYFFALSAGRNLSRQEKELALADTFIPVLTKQNDPVRSALLFDLSNNCERFGFDLAKDSLVSFIVTNNVPIQADSEKMQRLLTSANIRSGKKAPDIDGINMLGKQPLLLVFYESGCDNCIEELEKVVKYYPVLQKKGIQVVSVSADLDDEVFRYFSTSMPWKHKLCDYAGFEGTNFVRYGVVGTPVFYLIDKDGILVGRYAEFSDTGIVNE